MHEMGNKLRWVQFRTDKWDGSLALHEMHVIFNTFVVHRTWLIGFVFASDDVREKMRTRYLSNPDYNFEKVNRASMACGPMVKWAIAQVRIMTLSAKFLCRTLY